jgi:peptide/nickel transport system substrate-binding protein
VDEKKRADMYFECQKLLKEEGGVIVYLFKDNVEAVNEKIRFGKVAGNWEADGCKASERWWFA